MLRGASVSGSVCVCVRLCALVAIRVGSPPGAGTDLWIGGVSLKMKRKEASLP